ncbi:AbrB/MazE/SpoVT family DNA-binding domain-containing protein [Phyllobacterium sp. SYP-B3895]|uniref:AbrB/MazE/SpoVT family DNA-binding domain-containing protein n=1 Tax=Phyllobacterium pellucidum TaxID=2740464 RepID=A0A849VUU0_9HYPH|nr:MULTISPECIES: AbrB/MazE/SpoVT family DNA-binding domain-containing protein [Phyllobacterium]MRG56697.1 AbrB/MazE/SpoVT family DNA-binding domain-containing protein [Phyllobacterium sp. SYP-B3895]NTS31937.1 AbrB/MazE/SpoVT family DNA-binding domain-containing protein [Phyllobacterium pellucidum]
MRSSLRKMGNSSGIIIPKPFLVEIGSKPGDEVDLVVEDGRIVISPVPGTPRARWAEDAKRVAAAGDDELLWPEFPNEADGELKW